jgi:hypothetical protein
LFLLRFLLTAATVDLTGAFVLLTTAIFFFVDVDDDDYFPPPPLPIEDEREDTMVEHNFDDQDECCWVLVRRAA